MKLKSFFYILALLLGVVWVLMFFIGATENGWKFYCIEGIITVGLLDLVYFQELLN